MVEYFDEVRSSVDGLLKIERFAEDVGLVNSRTGFEVIPIEFLNRTKSASLNMYTGASCMQGAPLRPSRPLNYGRLAHTNSS